MNGIRLLATRSISVEDEIAFKVDLVKELKENAQEATTRFEEAQAELVALIGDGYTGNRYRARVVRKDSVKINETGLKKALGARLFNKATKTVLDRKKLDELMQTGEIDPVIVSTNSEIVPQKPYISFTKVTREEDASE